MKKKIFLIGAFNLMFLIGYSQDTKNKAELTNGSLIEKSEATNKTAKEEKTSEPKIATTEITPTISQKEKSKNAIKTPELSPMSKKDD